MAIRQINCPNFQRPITICLFLFIINHSDSETVTFWWVEAADEPSPQYSVTPRPAREDSRPTALAKYVTTARQRGVPATIFHLPFWFSQSMDWGARPPRALFGAPPRRAPTHGKTQPSMPTARAPLATAGAAVLPIFHLLFSIFAFTIVSSLLAFSLQPSAFSSSLAATC